MNGSRYYERSRKESGSYSTWNKGSFSNLMHSNSDSYMELSGNSYNSDDSSKDTAFSERIKGGNSSGTLADKIVSKRANEINKQNDEYSLGRIRMEMMNYLLYLLFGDKSKSYEQWKNEKNNTAIGNDNFFGSGGQITYQSSFYESETTSFETTGMVRTADGRSIDFNMNLVMSRTFYEKYSERMVYGDPYCIDPLVINVGSNVTSVSDTTFYFDLDADGTKENINGLNSGSGFLSIDLNEDGIINDGNELFGTKSGNGFEDLLIYDEDHNGWIDEADSVYDKLKVWYMDGSTDGKLVPLKEAGVGAIYLGNVDTEHAIKDNSNKDNAFIRKTGIFLYENGSMGTMQQLDMVAHTK